MKNKLTIKSKKKLILSILVFNFLFLVNSISASTTDGNIDYTYRYAWGENVGFIDFGSTGGAVHITDTALSGYAYGENIGWINLTGVTNNNEGALSGYAWGENVGFIDFSKVTIGTDGIFAGSAYGENIGWITFDTTNNKVLTDWRPKSSRRSHSSSGSYVPRIVTPVIPPVTALPVIPTTPIIPNPTNPNPIDGQFIIRTLKLTIPRMKGDDVKELQIYLNTKLNLTLITDGVFGPNTKQAVIDFQKLNNIKQDGIVGPITRGYLK